jgi:signal transduction histidine kinase
MVQRRLWLNQSPLQAAPGTLLVAALLLAILLLFQQHLSPFLLQLGFDALVGPVCMLIYVLLLRVPSNFPSQQSLFDGLVALLLSLVLAIVSVLVVALPLHSNVPPGPWSERNRYELLAIFEFFSNIGTFLVFRLGVRLCLFWNQLRRRHLLWALTHAHIMLVAFCAGLLIFLLEVFLIFSLRSLDMMLLVPTTLGLLVLGVIGLALVVPPSVLFSYFVMRRTTDRVKTLAQATSLLQRGHYTVRVPVVGEDEVAQLQSDFNMMAAELERSVRELQAERDRVTALLRQRRELIANVSHELRTPMATLRGYLETSLIHWNEQEQPPPTLQQDLQIMEEEVIRLQTLVEDLFTLASAEVGKLTLQCKPTDVSSLVQHIVSTAASLVWHSGKIEIVADIADELPAVLADPVRLEQVLRNLLHNAFRHTAPGGIIGVTASAEAPFVVLHVKDTGEGIDPAELPHVWQRFYQASSANARAHGGLGLGLALVKELVEEMGGSVAVESRPGEGSCFTVRLASAPEAKR